MTEESMKASNDLIRWLKMLALPRWTKIVLALIMLLVLFSALGLLAWSLWTAHLEAISAAVTILTVGLPVGLIVIALVFGDGGAGKLKDLTKLVLVNEVPEAILQNLASTSGDSHYQRPKITHTFNGCIADYVLSTVYETSSLSKDSRIISLEFKLELNVKKANLVVWIPIQEEATTADPDQQIELYRHCFFGAAKEGYIQNTSTIDGVKPGHAGFTFIKSLSDDFLLSPGERLYFAQDLAFFVRALLNIEMRHE